ncbi:MAG: fatty acid--CoA ligase family protein [Spongiibacteraceae bacterium]
MSADNNKTLEALCADALNTAGDKPAIEFEQRWFTWGEMRQVAEQLNETVSRLASTNAGTVRVAFIARNRPSAIAAFLAMLAQRCSVRMIYPFQSSEAIARELDQIDADLVVAAEQDFTETLVNALREKKLSAVALSDMQARAVLNFDRHGGDSGVAQVTILTSGTTGKPKPFTLSYAMIAEHVVGKQRSVGARSGPLTADAPPPILMFPLGNITGLHSTLPPLVNGERLVVFDRFTIPAWLDYVARYRPVTTGLPPVGIQMLLDANVSSEQLGSIRALGTGAAPLPPNVHRAFEERFGIPILLSYGATEFGGPVTRMTPDLIAEWGAKKFGSVGKAIPGVSLRVIDAQSGAVLPPNSEGVLEVISPRIGSEWIRTSDLAKIDDDGFLFLLGRADGAIMRGGFKILPVTIENALALHPAVAAVAVVGVKDRRLGEVPAAVIELKTGASTTAEALEEHLRKHVPSTHIPLHWRILESLPRTPSMKIDLGALRRLFEAEILESTV